MRITNYFNAPLTNICNDTSPDETSMPANNQNEQHTKAKTNSAKSESPSSIATYYNNVRCITNKRNICMKIELSVYKVLCFTETWLADDNPNSVYFPCNFKVYRCDRMNTASRVCS